MDTYKRVTKRLVVIFCLINIPVQAVAIYCRYLIKEPFSDVAATLFGILVTALVYIPFEVLICKKAKLAGMKKIRVFFGLCVAIHLVYIIGYSIAQVAQGTVP